MGSKRTKSLALFLLSNVLLFTTLTACGESPCHKPTHKHTRKPTPTPSPWPPTTGPGSYGTCPRDALKLGVCAKLLDTLLNITIGNPPVKPCCSLIQGLADLEAAVCLCTAIKANILGIHLNVPLSLSLLLNVCGCKVPDDEPPPVGGLPPDEPPPVGGLPPVEPPPVEGFPPEPGEPPPGVPGYGVLGLGLGLGLCGFGVPLPHSPHAETREKKRRLRTRKRARDWEILEAILISTN
ncbi:hypothetical protein Cgig2_008572 [Carnegiea gigantea]|uniref:Bifunctional inhibitor/plant lipid transfer protein/seed storage helical domain-containing protein n=1 Tax=Carnegiea gigantea TaxID=171969 RepID=A0A9Q1JLP8_9CARY|nr:hypothetical protein Cgig2_008572 [Carnegiea gigantea]